MFCFAAAHFRSSIAVTAVLAAGLASFPALCQNAAPAVPPSAPELRVFDPSLIDKTVDPCDNFYHYSCNGWFKRNPLPADQASYGRFTELYELNRLHLRQILEETAVPAATRSANEQKIGDDYASCMDAAAVNKLGLAPLTPELDRIAALQSAAELPVLLAHLHAIGVNAFFGMGSNQDFADSSAMISFYNAGGLGLPERDYYTRTDAKSVEQRQQYVAHMSKIFTLAGEPEAQAAKDARSAEPEPSHGCGRLRKRDDSLFAGRLCGRRARARRGQGERYGAEVYCGVQQPGCRYAHRADQDLPALAPAARLCRHRFAGELRSRELELLLAHSEWR
jgi:endothelin-converting enzyme/putative endopeptidase